MIDIQHIITEIKHIVDDGDRLLLYGQSPSYYIIAPINQKINLKPSDKIEYEPYGANFGFFIQKIEPND